MAEYVDAAFFTAVAVIGVLVLAWIGRQRIRGLASILRREQREEEAVARYVQDGRSGKRRLEGLRNVYLHCARGRQLAERMREEARGAADQELVEFFDGCATAFDELAGDADDFLRSRWTREEERPTVH